MSSLPHHRDYLFVMRYLHGITESRSVCDIDVHIHIDQAHNYCGMADVIPLREESHSEVVCARKERHTWPFNIDY